MLPLYTFHTSLSSSICPVLSHFLCRPVSQLLSISLCGSHFLYILVLAFTISHSLFLLSLFLLYTYLSNAHYHSCYLSHSLSMLSLSPSPMFSLAFYALDCSHSVHCSCSLCSSALSIVFAFSQR